MKERIVISYTFFALIIFYFADITHCAVKSEICVVKIT